MGGEEKPKPNGKGLLRHLKKTKEEEGRYEDWDVTLLRIPQRRMQFWKGAGFTETVYTPTSWHVRR